MDSLHFLEYYVYSQFHKLLYIFQNYFRWAKMQCYIWEVERKKSYLYIGLKYHQSAGRRCISLTNLNVIATVPTWKFFKHKYKFWWIWVLCFMSNFSQSKCNRNYSTSCCWIICTGNVLASHRMSYKQLKIIYNILIILHKFAFNTNSIKFRW